MRLAELSKRSGVSTATIKYYLREGLLAPGRRVNATTAEYDAGHLRRLRLVRALIQVGGVPVATARQVLAHVDDESLGRTMRLGAALWALPQDPEPDQADPAVAAARAEVDRLLGTVGWERARELAPLSPVHRSLVTAVAALRRLGYPVDAELMAPYAELMQRVARQDLDLLQSYASEAERVEAAVAAAVLFEPVLRALHRLAQEEESARRFGIE
ncbi:MerR family transcriptional regulator [Streptomyces poriticola]|uniref:MerR family transcriptional regulator n=1 Tax=Streptomyces poriticola TaxID=3120506 RepID=UPI002FCE60B2